MPVCEDELTAQDALNQWRTSSGHYNVIIGNGWEDTKSVGCALKTEGVGGFAHCWFAKS